MMDTEVPQKSVGNHELIDLFAQETRDVPTFGQELTNEENGLPCFFCILLSFGTRLSKEYVQGVV